MAFQDEQSQQYGIDSFKGFNQAIGSQFIDSGQTQNAQNMDIDDGSLAVCKGYSKYSDVQFTGGIKSLMAFYRDNQDGSQTSYLLASSDTTLYYLNNSEWQVLKTGLLNGYFDYVNYQEDMTSLIIMGNGYNDMLKWDGVNMIAETLGGTPPKAGSIALHFERIWASSENSNPNRVYYSNALAPEDWTQTENTGGFLEIPTWDGGTIIGIVTIFNDIVIFKTNNIFRIYGTYPGEYDKQQIFSATGAIAKRSIVQAINEAYFLAKDGIYVYNGTQTQKISLPIQDIINSMNKTYEDKAVGVFFNNKYILAIPEGDSIENSTIIEYDVLRQQFTVKRGIKVNTFLKYNDKLLFANDDTFSGKSYVYEYNSGSDFDGNVINAFWETPDTDFGVPNAVKTSTYFYATVQGSGQLKLEAVFDSGNSSTALIDLNTTPKVIKERIRNKGRRFKFKFSNVNGNYFKIIHPVILMDVDID